MKLKISFALCLLFLGFLSCSKRYDDLAAFHSIPIYDAENNSVGRFKTSYMADQINAYFNGSVNGPIAVATFVDIDNLYSTSTFGRILSEQLISELAMRGYTVLEVRQSDALQIINDEGEFGLSRDTKTLRSSQEIAGLIVGTYAVSPERVYLNARLIDPASAKVISVGSVEMYKSREIASLLRSNSFPSSLERIPVRQMGSTVTPLQSYSNVQTQNPYALRYDWYALPEEEKKPIEQKKEAKESKVEGTEHTKVEPIL